MCVIGGDLRRHAKLGGLVFDRLRALLFATAVSVYDTLPQNTYVDNKEKKNPEVVYFTNSLFALERAKTTPFLSNAVEYVVGVIPRVIACRPMSIIALLRNGDSSPRSLDRRRCLRQS